MRLLLIQAGFGAGGAEKVTAMLAVHRQNLGDEVHVAGMDLPPGGSYFPYPAGVALHVPEPAAARGPLHWQRLRHIRRVIREVQPDAAVSFLIKVNVLTLAASLGSGLPVVISERNNPLAQDVRPVWHHGQALLARRAAAIVMQTRRARADLPAALRRRAAVIANPCAPYDGVSTGPAPAPGPDGLKLAAVGRLVPQKGFDLLLEAMARIGRTLPATRLTIWGEGPERARLEAQRAQLGLESAVRLPGTSPAPGSWIADADILLLTSRFEGFPNVLAEAAVHGLPMVSFDCPYGPRELIRDGGNGLLVPPEDPAALSEAVIRLARDAALRARMKTAAPAVQKLLAPERVLAEWDRVIEAAVQRRGSAVHSAARTGVSSSKL